MPDWVKGPDLTVMVGIFKGGARLRIIQGTERRRQPRHRRKIKTGLTAAPEEHAKNDVPTMTHQEARRESEDRDRRQRRRRSLEGSNVSTGPFVDVGTGKPNAAFPVNGSAKLAFDDTNLYVLFNISDPDVIGRLRRPQD